MINTLKANPEMFNWMHVICCNWWYVKE